MKKTSIHERTNDQAVSLSIRATTITARHLAGAMQAYLKHSRDPTAKKGYQSLRSLSQHGASLANVEVSGVNIGSFRKVARKYNIDFALQKDSLENPPRWLVFFKARDERAMTSAFEEFSKSVLPRAKAERPPLLERLAKFKEKAKAMLAPVRNRQKSGIEL